MSIEFHHLFPGIPEESPFAPGRKPYGAPAAARPLPPTLDLLAEIPELAAALSDLDTARAAILAEVDRMAALVAEYAAYTEKAKAGKASGKDDVYWQARADEIRAAYRAAVVSAVDVQNVLVDLAVPHAEAARQRDLAEIRELADRLSVLIGRSTGYVPESVVLLRTPIGATRVGSVRDILAALHVLGSGAR